MLVNIIISIIVFIFLFCSFYIIINFFNINNITLKKNNSMEEDNKLYNFEKHILELKSEISNLKNTDIYTLNNKLPNIINYIDNKEFEKPSLKTFNEINPPFFENTKNMYNFETTKNNDIDNNQDNNEDNNEDYNENNKEYEINVNNNKNSENYQNCNSNINNPILPPVIFDPIANFDRAKLIDPLVDPRGRTSADQIPTPIVAAQFNFPTQGILDRYHRIGLLIAVENELDNFSDNFSDNDSGSLDYKLTGKFKKGGKNSSDYYKDYYNNNLKNFKNFRNNSNSDNYSDNSTNNSTNSSSSPRPYKGVEFAHEGFENINNTNIYNIGNLGENDILELIGKKITDNWYKYFTSISKGNKVIKINVHNRNRKELYCGDEVYIPELKRRYRVKIDQMDQIEYNPYLF